MFNQNNNKTQQQLEFQKGLASSTKISSVIKAIVGHARAGNISEKSLDKSRGLLLDNEQLSGKERKERVKLKETLVGQNETSLQAVFGLTK